MSWSAGRDEPHSSEAAGNAKHLVGAKLVMDTDDDEHDADIADGAVVYTDRQPVGSYVHQLVFLVNCLGYLDLATTVVKLFVLFCRMRQY